MHPFVSCEVSMVSCDAPCMAWICIVSMQAVYEEVMLHRSAGDASVMDTFEAPFTAAEGWVGEEAANQQSFTR